MNAYTEKELAYSQAVKAAYAKANAIGLKGEERTDYVTPLFAKELEAMVEEQKIQAAKNLAAMPSAWDKCTTGYAVAING